MFPFLMVLLMKKSECWCYNGEKERKKERKKKLIVAFSYCHVYAEGELEELIEKNVKNVTIIERFRDSGNWGVVIRKGND